jgi:hypothetical protein
MEEPTVNPGWRKSSYSDNGGSDCVEVGAWRKSSYSDNGGAACVEVGSPATSSAVTGVLVRDTTDRAGAVLAVPAAAWRALVAEVRG